MIKYFVGSQKFSIGERLCRVFRFRTIFRLHTKKSNEETQIVMENL